MRLFFLLLFFGTILVGRAQSDIFEIDGRGNRDIERASRINSAPRIIDSIRITAVPTRSLLDPKQGVKVLTDTIQAATIETEQLLEKYYPFYLKAGMGSPLMPLGEFYVNSTRSRANYYGLHVKHLSFFGNLKNREKQELAPAGFDRTSVEGNFETFQNNFSLATKLNYFNHGFHYYGLQSPETNPDSIAQRYQIVDAKVVFQSLRGDTAKFNIKTTANFRFTGTDAPLEDSLKDWKATEQAFHINALGNYIQGNHEFYGNFGVRYNGYKYGLLDSVLSPSDSGLFRKNTLFDFQPGVKALLLNNNLLIDAGFMVNVDVAQITRAYFFPKVYMQYSLLNSKLIPYLSLGGQVKQNSLNALYHVNPYINTNLLIENESNPYDIQVGIKGNAARKFTYGLVANFTKVNHRAFFVTDTLGVGNRFDLVYDSLNHTKIEGRFGYQAGKKLQLDLIARYHSYEMFNEAKAWNLPQAEILINAEYNLYDKFLVHADLNITLNRYAKMYAPGEGIETLNNQYFYNLGPIIDGNIGLEYRYSKRFSAFLQANNVASQRYLQFYNYPVLPIQIFAGATIRF